VDAAGQVRITLPDGKLTADTATVSFKDNQIVRAQIRGAPPCSNSASRRPASSPGGALNPSSTTCATTPCSSWATPG